MTIKTVWAQRAERYEGEYAPELLGAIDEYGDDENPGYMAGIYKDAMKQVVSGELYKVVEIDVLIDRSEIDNILMTPRIKGEIKEHPRE